MRRRPGKKEKREGGREGKGALITPVTGQGAALIILELLELMSMA